MSQDLPSPLQLFNESEEHVSITQHDAASILDIIEQHESAKFELVELVYVSEDEIVRINKEHLDRDYVTDIISFRYDDDEDSGDNTAIEGTLFCCAPRIKEQAEDFGETADQEFKRILIHGLLHLIGYDDRSEAEKKRMTELENTYLSLSGKNN